MQNVLITVSYDGTDFSGWQRQDKSDYGNPVRTVQGEIEAALKKMLRTDITLYGSGRTDSGVHAASQAANFFSPFDSIQEENYLRALNGLLPLDVRVMDVKKVPDEFNARFSATARTYRYFINTSGIVSAKDSRYVWLLGKKLDIKKLNAMCRFLKGENDFATFTASGDQSRCTCRFVKDAFFYEQDAQTVVFQIEANAFLWKMVRSLTGTLVECCLKNKTPEDFESILKSCDRSRALVTAPPQGLFLYNVSFEGERIHP